MHQGKPQDDWCLKDLSVGRFLGRGTFGRVHLAKQRSTGLFVALKTLSKSKIARQNMDHQVSQEIEIQTHLSHPNILKMLTCFEDNRNIYMVLEFAAEGELYKNMHKQPNHRFAEPKAAKYTYQVADALHYCHLNKVMHRDIKPQNLLLTDSGDVQLADFGWSVHSPWTNRRQTMCGTLYYLPPEMVEDKVYTELVDHWSLGVLCFEFLVGWTPFETGSTNSTYNRISRVDFNFPVFVPVGAKDLISRLLRHNPQHRIPLPGVMQHPWISYNRSQARS